MSLLQQRSLVKLLPHHHFRLSRSILANAGFPSKRCPYAMRLVFLGRAGRVLAWRHRQTRSVTESVVCFKPAFQHSSSNAFQDAAAMQGMVPFLAYNWCILATFCNSNILHVGIMQRSQAKGLKSLETFFAYSDLPTFGVGTWAKLMNSRH